MRLKSIKITGNGDGRDIVGGGHGVATGAVGTIRSASLAYLGQIARSAEQLGFEAALTPTGAWCEDAWLTTALLTEVTKRLKFLVAFRPGLISPTLSAQMAATADSELRPRPPDPYVPGICHPLTFPRRDLQWADECGAAPTQ